MIARPGAGKKPAARLVLPRRHRTTAVRTPSGTAIGLLIMKSPSDGRGALYEQLARRFKQAILAGRLPAGQQLPSTRDLAHTLGLSRNTVVTAYELLRAEQLITSHERSVTRVAPLTGEPRTGSRPLTPPQSRYAARLRALSTALPTRSGSALSHDLRDGTPINPDLTRAWARKLAIAARVAPRTPADPQGFFPLRTALVEHLARRRGVSCSEDDILIVGDVQQAITVIARAVLNEGDCVAIEEPHPLYVMQTLRAHGARILGASYDGRGLITTDLARHKTRLICTSPAARHPSGSAARIARRSELLDVATEQQIWILEGSHDLEFQYCTRSNPLLRAMDFSGRVIYVGAFSNTLLPSLQLGFIVCPPEIRDDLCRVKQLDGPGSPLTEQVALSSFMHGGQFDRHVRHTIVELERRRRTFIDALRRWGRNRLELQETPSGTHLIAWVPGLTHAQLSRLIERGAARGLGLCSIHVHYCSAPRRPGLHLCYAGLPPEALERAAELLAVCLEELEATDRPPVEARSAQAPARGPHTGDSSPHGGAAMPRTDLSTE
jgi:GntR family transcriptional regulator/MocR family aminotransferase